MRRRPASLFIAGALVALAVPASASAGESPAGPDPLAGGVKYASTAAAAPTTERISVSSAEQQGDWVNSDPATSDDGALVVFESGSDNLVRGDTNNRWDVFLRDRAAGTTRLLSRTSAGLGNGHSTLPSISGTGRYVTFSSGATNLVPGDTNAQDDVFRLDRTTGSIRLVSVGVGGTAANDSSGEAVSAVSDNGRFVAFVSRATNLTAVSDTNDFPDIFLRDLTTNTTVLVSRAMDGTAGSGLSNDAPEISANGRYVAFSSSSSDLVPGDTNGGDVFVYDRVSRTTTLVSVHPDGGHYGREPSISDSGGVVAFTGFEAPGADFFSINEVWAVHLSVNGSGVPQPPAVGDVELVSQSSTGALSNGLSRQAAISGNGAWVAFVSTADNLVTGDTNDEEDVFLHRLGGGVTKRVNVSASVRQANGATSTVGNPVDVDDTGSVVVFHSSATNLVTPDTNTRDDIFARVL